MVVRRLTAFGSGWIPWGDDAANLAQSLPRMRAEVERGGRDFGGIGVVGYLRLHRAGEGFDLPTTMAE